ncbi:MAG: alpha-mannosidase, partial [Kiritimatiellia bacterium]
MAAIRATFRSALARMREEPDFIYSFSSPAVFEWIREVDPGLFLEIRERVREGRWELVEGWWVQPDCHGASGESYARQGLYGQRWLERHFGRRARIGFNTDSFGHNAMLPQIYRLCGVEFYVFGRPTPEEQG